MHLGSRASYPLGQRHYADILFPCVKVGPSVSNSTGLLVPVRSVGDSVVFSVRHKNCPSARCLKAAKLVCGDVDVFRKPVTVLNQILYLLT